LRLEVVIDDLPEQLEGHLKLQMPAEIKVQEAAASASRSKKQLTAVGGAEASEVLEKQQTGDDAEGSSEVEFIGASVTRPVGHDAAKN